MKKIIPICVVCIFILSGFGASAHGIFNIDGTIEYKQKKIFSISGNDELDQYQPDMNNYGIVGRFPDDEKNMMMAQSFIPTKNILTRVKILAGKSSTAIYDYKLAIRDNLSKSDLTSLSLSLDNFPTDNTSWIEFDFDDIILTPGITYYIVSYTTDAPNNFYFWGAIKEDVYLDGLAWWSDNDGTSWNNIINVDLTFATYGLDNVPPGAPDIDGPTSGKPGTAYPYKFISMDPDGDDVSYYIRWGDGNIIDWTDFLASGPPGYTESHSWDKEGTYIIQAKAKDIYGAESGWSELSVNMPRNKVINTQFYWLQNFLQTHPNLFPILRHLLGS